MLSDKYYGTFFFHVTKLVLCVLCFLFCLMVKMKTGIYVPVHVLVGRLNFEHSLDSVTLVFLAANTC